ncbi:helix-turn-helix domain-containing protein [Nonomuraea sp. B1E8]|uniref:helix-turn-helix domain-containing protein n=1 Tax=unclassified Nonomuraea TaxID=2593643 RepID=UPI00325E6A8D
MSARTLTRRFVDQLGTSPGQWLLAQRIATARGLLESSGLPLDAVARRVGLSSATNLRRPRWPRFRCWSRCCCPWSRSRSRSCRR